MQRDRHRRVGVRDRRRRRVRQRLEHLPAESGIGAALVGGQRGRERPRDRHPVGKLRPDHLAEEFDRNAEH
jgi:hypothetical protein